MHIPENWIYNGKIAEHAGSTGRNQVPEHRFGRFLVPSYAVNMQEK